MQQWQYQQYVAPLVDSQTTATRQSWEPHYPDTIDRTRLPTAAIPTFATTYVNAQSTETRQAWKPQYPDRLPRTWLSSAAQLAYVSGRPDLQTLDTYGWRPIAPAWIDRRTMPAALQLPFATTWVNTQATDTRTWRPIFPDRHVYLPRLPGGGILGLPAALVEPYQYWTPSYPDQIDRDVLSTAAHPPLAYDWRETIPAPTRSWSPVYPDALRQGARLSPSESFQVLTVAAAPAPDRSWAPSFPDFARRDALLAASQQTIARPISDVFVAAVPVRSWAGVYADRIIRFHATPHLWPALFRGTSLASTIGAVSFSFPDDFPGHKGMHPSRMPAWTAGSQLVLVPTPFAWQGSQVQPHLRRTHQTPYQFPVPIGSFPSIVPFFQFRGYQPDQIARLALHPSAMPSWWFGVQSAQPVPALAWNARYPNRLDPARRVAEFLAWVQNLDPIPNPPSPDLAWQGEYPDYLWPLPSLRAALQQFWVSDRIRPVAPDFSWQAIAPDRIHRFIVHPAVVPSLSYQERVANIAPDPGRWWEGSYPTHLPARTRQYPNQAAALPADVEQAVSPLIEPVAPAYFWRVTPLQESSVQFAQDFAPTFNVGWRSPLVMPIWPIWRPSLLSPTAVGPVSPQLTVFCIELGSISVITPTLAPDDVLLPSLTSEAVIAQALANAAMACAGGLGQGPAAPGAGSGPEPPPPGSGSDDPAPPPDPPPPPTPPTNPPSSPPGGGGGGGGTPDPPADPPDLPPAANPPIVLGVSRSGNSPTAANAVSWQVTFSQAVTGVDAADFQLVASGLGGAPAITAITGTGSVYTVTASTGTGSGTLGLNVRSGATIVNVQNESLLGGFTGELYTVDHVAPTCTGITRQGSSPTNATFVSWTVTFSEAVTGVNPTDFQLAGTAAGASTITGVVGTGASYDVTAQVGIVQGGLGLTLLANGSIQDALGNALTVGVVGPQYTVDRIAPIATGISRLDTDPTTAATIRWVITFSESVLSVDAADFSLTITGTVQNQQISDVSGSGTSRVVTVERGTGAGTITLHLNPNAVFTDVAGNPFAGPGLSGPPYTIPTITIPPGGTTYFVSTTGSDSNPGTLALPFRTFNYGVLFLQPGDTLLARGGTYVESLEGRLPSGTSWDNKIRIANYPGETVWLKPGFCTYVVSIPPANTTTQYVEFDGINLDAESATNGAVNIFTAVPAIGARADHIRIQNATILGPTVSDPLYVAWTGQALIFDGADNGESGFHEFRHLTLITRVFNQQSTDFRGVSIYMTGSDNLIEYCNMTNFGRNGIQIRIFANRNVVRYNIIHDNGDPTATWAWGIASVSDANHQIYGNVCYNIQGAATETAVAGILITYASGTRVYNNTVYNIQGTLTGYGIWSNGAGAGNSLVQNNIVYQTSGAPILLQASGDFASHNLTGIDPLFVNPAAGNFRLQAGSPALNIGLALPAPYNVDADGIVRPQGPAFDVGAYERL